MLYDVYQIVYMNVIDYNIIMKPRRSVHITIEWNSKPVIFWWIFSTTYISGLL